MAGSLAWAQTASPVTPSVQTVKASLPHLYWHFLLYQDHLDKAAAAREQQGKDGSWLRNHFQRKLGFTDAQFAIIRSTAQRLETELKGLDAQAKAIIDADNAQNPPSPSNPRWSRPVPPEIQALMQQHESVIQAEMASLKTALGPGPAARLDAFLESEVARNVTAQKVRHPLDPDAARQHLLQAIQKGKGVRQ